MKCFYRNETLHQTGPVGVARNRKPFSRRLLARGMAYATQHLEGRNSLSKGCYDVLTYPSRYHRDCECGGGSRLWRLQPANQSSFIQVCSTDADCTHLIYDAVEQHQGSRSSMGTSAFTRRTERFSSHRSRRRHLIAPGLRLHDGYSERRARGSDNDNRRRRGWIARILPDAAPWPEISQARDGRPGSPEHGGLWN